MGVVVTKKYVLPNSALICSLFALALVVTPARQAAAQQSGQQVVLKSWSLSWPEPREIWRILSRDLESLGIKLEIKTGSIGELFGQIIRKHNPYHMVTFTWGGTPDRLEPSYFLTEFFHSSRATPGGKNFGYYVNKEYDAVVDAQFEELDPQKRQILVRKAQEIIARDNVIFPVYHRDYVQVYNSKKIKGAISTIGSGVGFPYLPWTFLKAEPTTDLKVPRLVNRLSLKTVNPFGALNAQSTSWMKLMYDTLAKRDQNAKLIPWAAESWQRVDTTTYEVVLRGGMKFHDGKPVTVEDVKFTFDYIKKWKFPLFATTWKNVESTTIVGDRKLRLKLVRPFAPFVANILHEVFIVPKHIWKTIPESAGVANPMNWPNTVPLIGSGPYQMVERKKKEYFRLKAHKNHWIAPKFDGLYYIYIPTTEGMMAMLERDEAEIFGFTLDASQGKKLAELSHLTMVTAPSQGMTEIRPNVKMKPMDDPAFRRAIQHAIDRKKMLDVIFLGYGIVAHNTPITPLLKYWNNPNIPVVEFDLDKARKILKSAGYTWDDKGRLLHP